MHSTIHALTGYDTTSKVGKKFQAFKTAHKSEYASLNKFGISEFDKCIEQFLLECIMQGENRVVNIFDELRYSRYHSYNLRFHLERFSCTSRSIRLDIQKAYDQRRLWFFA